MADRRPQSAWNRPAPPLPDATLGPAVLAIAASLVALWPFTAAIQPGSWTLVSVIAIVVVCLTGMLVRRLLAGRRPTARTLTALLAQLVVLTVTLTAALTREAALYGLIPTPASLRFAGARLLTSVEEIANGVVPVAATTAMATVTGIAFGLVAIAIDLLISGRLVVATAIMVAGVGAVPMILGGGVNIPWFLLLAATIFVLFRYATRRDPTATRQASVPVVASVSIVTVLTALAIAPGVPVSATPQGIGPAITIDANLRLGDDLRRPDPIPVMTLVTTQETAPYLRMATLSRFDGEVWRPDRPRAASIDQGFGEPDWSAQIPTAEHRTSIRIGPLTSSRLPLPYAATKVSGLADGWRALPENRTAVSEEQSTSGADYTVTSTVVTPTLEQIRAASATGAPVGELPDDLPAIIGETAREVTDGAENDYDRLIAMQDWFRSEFEYSLDTPVQDGFDGTGADAVATFLRVRSGYCVHFAGAYALMARSLGMPVRIAVGYLPGVPTGEEVEGDPIYQVESDQLHSWPEVFFAGIGWVPFEPTATLGVPTDFAPAASSSGGGGSATPSPTTAPTAAPTDGPTVAPEDDQAGAAGQDTLRRLDPGPVLLTALGILLVLALPAAIRFALRRLRLAAARRGDALAAWSEIEATMIDLRLPTSPADTARARGVWIVADRAADAADVDTVVGAVERACYAEDPHPADGRALTAATIRVLRTLRASSDGRQRVIATMLPLSLVPRRTEPTLPAPAQP